MKPLVHTFLLALILTVGIHPHILLGQDKLSNWYIQEVFLLADLNQDKYLSEPEILQLRENFAYYQNPENFDITDKNKDNYLDYKEFRYRFGQALVHRQEVDGKELKILSENYPYFEDATFKYLKRHPELTARLMNNLIWTREHPDLMKQIISDKGWLSKEPEITEALGSNLIWLAENPNLAKKFYQSKRATPLSDIWQSWGITHRNYLSQHKIEEGIQIDFPFWPADTEEAPQTELLASTPSPGEQQRWMDSVLMKSMSLETSLKKAEAELQRRDSVAVALFENQALTPVPEDNAALKSEVETLRTQVRKMRIEKRLSRIEEDILLKKTIKQQKQLALLEKEQEFSEQDGMLTINSKPPLEEELERYEAQLAEKDQRIEDLNNSISQLNQANQSLTKEKNKLQDITQSLRMETDRFDLEKDSMIRDLAANDTEQIFLQKEQELQEKVRSLEKQNAELIALQQDYNIEKEELESSIARIIESKQEDNQDLIAIEEQYKQQILALDIELEKAMAERETAVGASRQVQSNLSTELESTQKELAMLEGKVGELENEKLALNQSLTRALSAQREAEVAEWAAERDSLSQALAKSEQQIISLKAEQALMAKNLETQQKYGLEAEKAELAKITALTQEKDSLLESLAQSNQQIVALTAEQELLTKNLETQKNQISQAGKAENAQITELQQERDALKESLAQSNQQIVALSAEQELLTENLETQKNQISQADKLENTQIAELQQERDALKESLAQSNQQIVALSAEQELLTENLETQKNQISQAGKAENAQITELQQERDALKESLAQSNQQIVALTAEQELLAENLKTQKNQISQADKAEAAQINALTQERDALTESLAQSNKQIVALLSEKEELSTSLAVFEKGEAPEQNWTESRLKERDSLFITLNTATLRIQKLEKKLSESESLLNEQKKILEDEKAIAVQAEIPAEYDALFLRVNELEYDNGRLKDELEATLAMANERETILEKRLKSSEKESKRMASQMRRVKRRKNGKSISENSLNDNLAMELEEGKAKLKEMKEVNQALLAQLQANNNYLGHNISKRDQYKQELYRLKTNLSKAESQNDSLQQVIKHRPRFAGPARDSLMAYQEKIYNLQSRIQVNQSNNQAQLSRLNLEIDSLETEVITLEEEKASIAQIKKVEASRSQLSGDREKRLKQLESELQEKELTLKQKEKVIQDKLKDIAVKEKKYQDMRRWEEQLHLLERKLKINPAYEEAKKENQ